MTLTLAVRLTADAAGLTGGVQTARDALGALSGQADRIRRAALDAASGTDVQQRALAALAPAADRAAQAIGAVASAGSATVTGAQDRVLRALDDQRKGHDAAAKSAGAYAAQLRALRYNLFDIVNVAVAARGDPLSILLSSVDAIPLLFEFLQGQRERAASSGQPGGGALGDLAGPALDAAGKSSGLLAGAWTRLTAAGLPLIGTLAAVAAAAGAAGAAIAAHLTAVDAFNDQLQAISVGSQAARDGLRAVAEQASGDLATLGPSTARSVVATLARSSYLTREQIGDLTRLAPDAADLWGTDAVTAAGRLAEMFDGTVQGAERMRAAFRNLSAEDMVLIRHLDDSGRQTEAFDLMLQRLHPNIEGAARGATWMARAWQDVAHWVDRAWDAVGHIADEPAAVDVLAASQRRLQGAERQLLLGQARQGRTLSDAQRDAVLAPFRAEVDAARAALSAQRAEADTALRAAAADQERVALKGLAEGLDQVGQRRGETERLINRFRAAIAAANGDTGQWTTAIERLGNSLAALRDPAEEAIHQLANLSAQAGLPALQRSLLSVRQQAQDEGQRAGLPDDKLAALIGARTDAFWTQHRIALGDAADQAQIDALSAQLRAGSQGAGAYAQALTEAQTALAALATEHVGAEAGLRLLTTPFAALREAIAALPGAGDEARSSLLRMLDALTDRARTQALGGLTEALRSARLELEAAQIEAAAAGGSPAERRAAAVRRQALQASARLGGGGTVPGGSGTGTGPYAGLLAEAASAYGLDPAVLAAIMRVESGGVASATGPLVPGQGRAMGLMQVMPATWAGFGGRFGADPYDPRANILAGAATLRQFLDAAGGDLGRALNGYSGGGGAAYLAAIRAAGGGSGGAPANDNGGDLAGLYGQTALAQLTGRVAEWRAQQDQALASTEALTRATLAGGAALREAALAAEIASTAERLGVDTTAAATAADRAALAVITDKTRALEAQRQALGAAQGGRELALRLQDAQDQAELIGLAGEDLAAQSARLAQIADWRRRNVELTAEERERQLGIVEATARTEERTRAWSDAFQDVFGLAEKSLDAILAGTFRWQDALHEVLRIAWRIAVVRPAEEALSSALGGLNLGKWIGGLFGGGDGNVDAGFWGTTAKTFHTGGIVGAGRGPARIVPIGAWDGAPRYHAGGILPGERAIIARDGEGVFTAEQMAALSPAGGGVQVTVIDQRGGQAAPVEVQDKGVGPSGQRQIEILVRDTVRRLVGQGELDGAMGARFGARPPAVRRG